MTRQVPARRVEGDDGRSLGDRLTRTILDIAGRIPETGEHKASGPHERARAIAAAAANKAALAAGTLALPPGPLGWLTILPELAAIWRIQRQMVADIAGAIGVSAELTRSHMLYCLFRHTAAQAFRDLGVRLGQRGVVQALSSRALRRLVGHVGVSLSRRTVAKGVARWVPVVGAAGVAAYAWYDSSRIAATAIAMFDPVIDLPIEGKSINIPARRHCAGE